MSNMIRLNEFRFALLYMMLHDVQCKGFLLDQGSVAHTSHCHAAHTPQPSPLRPGAFARVTNPDCAMFTHPGQTLIPPPPDSPRHTLPHAFADTRPHARLLSPDPSAQPMDLWPPQAMGSGAPVPTAEQYADPLMSRPVADTGQGSGADGLLASRHQSVPGGRPYVSAPGGQSSIKRDMDGNVLRGPVASPNTKAALLPTNRHKVYPMAPDRFVQPLPPDLEPSAADFPCASPPVHLPLLSSSVQRPCTLGALCYAQALGLPSPD